MPTPPLHERLYRAILKLFPREFRGDFGEQMAADFSDQREEAAHRGAAIAVPRLWARTVIDALHRGPREHLDILRRDAGYALRLFRRRPGTTISALLTLAIGIGLTTAVFSVVYSVLWRNLPIHEADRLVYLTQVSPPPQKTDTAVSPDNFVDWHRQARTMKSLASVRSALGTIMHPSGAEEFRGAAVTRGFFDVLPARPILGRLFSDADFEPLLAQIAAQDPKKPSRGLVPTVTVIGYDLWQRQFGGRTDVIGQRVDFGRAGTVEIIGVLGRDFVLPVSQAEAFLPDVPELDNRRARYLTVLGRLEDQVTVRAAQAEFDVIANQLANAYPNANKDRGIRVTSMRDHLTADASTQLWFLFGTAICVLLIACANVSNLLLAHTSGRQRELQTRVALGASRAHLVRQALTEGLVLAAVGAAAGILLAWWAVPSLVAVAPRNIPRLGEVSVGWEAFIFAGSLAVCVGITCGLAAAVMAGRSGVANLRTTGAGSSSGRRFRQGLIVAEIALALMLAVAAGLLVQTLRVVTALPLGYDPSSVISIGFSPDFSRLEATTAKASFEAELLAAVRSVPGVIAAGVGSRPLNWGGMQSAIALPHDPTASIRISVDAVGPGYLEALGARLLAGRFFGESDDPQAPRVALVNETAAKHHWQGNAVGQTFIMNKRTIVVVGVLADVRRTGLEVDPEPTLYLPSVQTATFWTNNMLVRTAGDPRELLPAIRTVVRTANPRLPLRQIETLQERLAITTAPRRFTLWLVSLFSIIAVGLAVIGIYGVVMESVAQRVPEIGIRIALGASGATVMQMILRQGGWMIGIGVALGIGIALAMNGVMSAFVFRVPTTDPLSFLVACLALVSAGFAACAIPARRASRIDPVIALRQEL